MNALVIYLLPGIIMAFFYIYLFIKFTFPAFLLNVFVVTILYILIMKDLKDSDNHKYYLAGAILTALVFIFSTTNVVAYFFLLVDKIFLSELVLALFLIWGFAHVVALLYELFHHKKKSRKSKK